jgi:hypothetical protein
MKLPDIEVVSGMVHEAWMEAKRAAGVSSRKSETGEELSSMPRSGPWARNPRIMG